MSNSRAKGLICKMLTLRVFQRNSRHADARKNSSTELRILNHHLTVVSGQLYRGSDKSLARPD
jgi:hypothetical protein